MHASGASSSGNFSLGHDPNDSRGRIGVNAHHKTLVPGAPAPDTKTASKNAKRRQRAKVQHCGICLNSWQPCVVDGAHNKEFKQLLGNVCRPKEEMDRLVRTVQSPPPKSSLSQKVHSKCTKAFVAAWAHEHQRSCHRHGMFPSAPCISREIEFILVYLGYIHDP